MNRNYMAGQITQVREKVIRLYDKGRYQEALPLAIQVVAWSRDRYGTSDPELSASLNALAMIYHALGQLDAAEPLHQEALEIRRKHYGEQSRAVAVSLNNLAALYFEWGDFAKSEELYLRSLEIERSAQTTHNLAALYYTMSRLADAKPLFHEALAIRREDPGEESSDFAQTVNCLAALYFKMGDYLQAHSLFRKALKIRGRLGRRHPDYARTLNNLGAVYYTLGDLDKAERFYLRALKIRRQVFGRVHGECAQSLDNLGSVYRAKGRLEVSLRHYREALEIRRQLLPQDHPDVAASLHNVAALHSSMGDFNEAEPLCREALGIRQQALPPQHPDIAQSQYNLARLCAATDRADEAFELMCRASAIDDQMISQVFSIASESQRLSYVQELGGRLDGFLSLIVKHLPECRKAIHFGLDLVLRRKAILAEAMALQRDAIWRGKYPHLRPKLEALALTRQEIARATLEGPGREDLGCHLHRLAGWTARKEKLEIELAQQIPDIALDVRLRSADRQAVASALPAGSALIEFVRFQVCDFGAIPAKGESRWLGPRYLAFLVPAGQAEQVSMFDIGDADAVDRMIACLREMTTGHEETRALSLGSDGSGGYASFEDPSSALWRTLTQPMLQSLNGCRRLYIAPDGDLTRLPFEVLMSADGNRLIEEFVISYIGCGRDVLRFGRPPTTPCAKALVAADPNFDLALPSECAGSSSESSPLFGKLRDSKVGFGRLPGSRIEGGEIAALLGVEPWLGDSVLESSLKNFHSPWILHIATHGFFLPNPDPETQASEGRSEGIQPSELADTTDRLIRRTGPGWENPLVRSGLALAGAETWRKGGALPEAAEDGILTAEDVSGLDLLGTELVVLSACDTGLGEVQTGEGVFGLRRAFLLAGAQTLVMTLWKVEDTVTGRLMADFYRRLLTGEGPAGALHKAKLALMRSHPAPRYWAAFVCQGDPGPLRLDLA